MKKAKYICFEGTEGVGKTTQVRNTVEFLLAKGFNVLETKEPGTAHLPMTLILRALALDQAYDKDLTKLSREYIMQAIRSIHFEKLIVPAMRSYDFIIQDRGILSALSYGISSGEDKSFLESLNNHVIMKNGLNCNLLEVYDHIILLEGDEKKGLERAKSAKQEFKTGDVNENKGAGFLSAVSRNFEYYLENNKNISKINIDNKSIEDVFDEIKKIIE